MSEVGQDKKIGGKRIRRNKVRVLRSGQWSVPLDPEDMDGRYEIARAYREKFNSIIADLGGADNVSVLQVELARREAWASLWLGDFEIRYLAGAKITDGEFNRYICLRNSSSRISEKLGLKRRPKDITPLAERLAALAERSAKREEDNNGQD